MMLPVSFKSAESIIRGYFFPSLLDGNKATVIFLQGFPGVEGDELICEKLAQAGLNVLTFNYRGTFQSGGHFSFTNAAADIGAALRFITEPHNLTAYHINPDKIVLGGWSFGAAIAPAGMVQNLAFRRMFMISGRNFGREARKIERQPAYAQQVAQNLESLRAPKGPVHFQDDLIADLIANQDLLDHEQLASVLSDRRILLIGGWQDDVTPIEDHTLVFYRALISQGAAQVQIEAVADDHEFAKSKEQLVQFIQDWLKA